MLRSWRIGPVLYLSLLAWPFTLAAAGPPRVLLLAHFNKGITPDFGELNGAARAAHAGLTASGEGFPFKDSQPAAVGLDLRRRSSFVELPVGRAFDARAGTVQFWYRPTRPQAIPFAILFRVLFEETAEPQRRLDVGDQFVLFLSRKKSEDKTGLVFSSRSGERGIAYKTRPIAGPLLWQPDEWHFVTLTWSGEAGAIYLDGALAKEGRYVAPTSEPKRIVLGSDFLGHDAEGIIDELRILDGPLSGPEVTADYERGALERIEFPMPVRAEPVAAPSRALVPPYSPSEPAEGPSLRLSLEDVHFTALVAPTPPTIDGLLTDAAWQRAPETSGLMQKGRTREVARVQTHLRFLYDKDQLYIAARLDEPNMELLRMNTVRQRDMSVWRDDCLEVFVDTCGRADTFYHFVVNSAGTLADFLGSQLNWSAPGAQAAAAKAADHWSVELAIPFRDLGVTPDHGDVWGLRVCRARRALSEGPTDYSCLPHVVGGFKLYSSLGQLRFGAAEDPDAAVRVEPVPAPSPFLGLNVMRYTAENRGREPAQLVFTGRAIARSNLPIASDRCRATVLPNAKSTVTLELPVATDALEAVSVTVLDERTGRCVFGARVSCQLASTPMLDRIREAMPKLAALNLFLPPRSEVTKAAEESVQRFAQHLAKFEAALAEAIKEKQQVSRQVWQEFEQEIAGFSQWVGSHRMAAWPDDIWASGLTDSFPASGEVLDGLTVSMAGNEREATGFSLSGVVLPEPMDVQVVVNDLILEGKRRSPGTSERFGRNQIHLYWATPFRDEGRQLAADPLVRHDGNVFTLGAGRTLKLWVVLDSAGVSPGTYCGEIVVRPLDTLEATPDQWVRIPLSVTVWPFVLPETRDTPLEAFATTGLGAHFHLHMDPVEMTRDLYEHRINWVQCDWQEAGRMAAYSRGDAITADDLAACETLFKQAKARGMKVMFMWGACSPESVKPVAAYMRKMGFGDREFAAQSPHDEFAAKVVPQILEYHRKVRELGASMRYMTTYARQPPDGATLEQIEPMLKHIDIWVNHIGKWWPPSEEAEKLLDFQRKHGVTIAGYRCAKPMRPQPYVAYYRRFPWQAWRMRVQMILLWAYVAGLTGDNDPWDVHNFEGRWSPNGLVYPSTGGRINPSKRYEALREGLEDYCYLWLLQKRIEAAKKQNRDVSAAESFLKDIVEKALIVETMSEMTTVREALARQILALDSAPQ